MQAREFLALADQLAAFNAVMSGSLKKETEELKGALKALQEANDLVALQQLIEAEKQSFENYKASVEGVLKSSTEELATKEVAILSKEDALVVLRAELDVKEYNAKESVVNAEAALVAIKKEADKAEARLVKADKAVETAKADLAIRIAEVEAREAEVVRKLELLKSLA